MTPRPALAATIAASLLVLGATGALAAGSPQLNERAPDKTSPTTTPIVAPTTTLTPPPTAPPTAPSTTSTTLALANAPLIGDVVDGGDVKQSRFYDAYLAAGLADIQSWWAIEFPRLYGEPFTPLEGGIFAAYPERTDPIPGCGFPGNTSYQEVSDYGAFYCPDGDYMAYDDGELGVIYELAERFSPSVVAVVMAHEFGHAVQARTDALDRDVATIFTEQQADCFSGAWARRVWEGQAGDLSFGDDDIRTGLIALVAVADPIGTSVLEPGGHGAAFDRIGAFQWGFVGGIDNCVSLIDQPLPLLPNEFTPGGADVLTNGDARFGWEPGEIMDLLTTDLTVFWPPQVAANGTTMPAVSLRPITDPSTDNCADPEGMANFGAVYCAATNEVLFDESVGRVLYDDFGDFAVGYVIGLAWAEAAQVALGSRLEGEQRALASDCLVGAWIGTRIKFDPGTGPTTTTAAPPGSTSQMQVSPGDLDEAVKTALQVGDRGLGDNREGSAFEKIASMRRGVLNGLPSCLAEIAAS